MEALLRTCNEVQGLAEDLAAPARRNAAIKCILSEMDGMWDGPEIDTLAAALFAGTEDAVGDRLSPARRRRKKRRAR